MTTQEKLNLALSLGLDPRERLSRNIALWETLCPCGCGLYRVDADVLRLFEAIRSSCNAYRLGRAVARGLTITSGARCVAYQRQLIERGYAGSHTSLHIPPEGGAVGAALDIAAPPDMGAATFFAIAGYCMDLLPHGGLLLYPGQRFIHVDTGAGRAAGRRITM